MRNPEVSQMLFNQHKEQRETEKLIDNSIVKKLAYLAIRQSTIHDSHIVYEAIAEIERLSEVSNGNNR
jgi:hypothetical protein